MEFNPYQSPPEASSESARRRIPLKLRVPAVGLIFMSAMTILGCIALGALGILDLLPELNDFPEDRSSHEFDRICAFGVSIAVLSSNLIILFGAWQGFKAKKYRWALAAAILACIPFLTPIIYYGIPLGIWMLLALLRKDVKAWFDAQSSSQSLPISAKIDHAGFPS
jgi:hypothetical protein